MMDFSVGDTFDMKFSTRSFSTGAPTTLAGTPAVAAYPGNSTTELTAGITLTVDFDSRTGLHNVRVVATTGNGYAAGTSYALVITTGTVGGVSVVGEVVGHFTLGRSAAATRIGLLTATASTGDPGTTTGVIAYLKQLVNVLVGSAGVTTFPAEAAPANAVSLAEVLRAIHADVTGLNGEAMRGTDNAGLASELAKVPKSDSTVSWNATALAAINAECDTALADYDGPTNAEMVARTLAAADYFDPAADTVANVTLVATCTTNTDMRGTDGAYTGTPPTAGAIADQVWEEQIGDHSGTSGSTAEQLAAAGAAGDPWATALPGSYTSGQAGNILGNTLPADVVALSGDSTAADNLEAMYDGTGFTDDNAPATQAQVGALSAGSSSGFNFAVSADNTGGAIIDGVTFVGTQTGTFANTEANTATFHQIDDDTNAFDLVYRIASGATNIFTALTINAYLNSSNDTANIQLYDHVGADWETVRTINGKNGSAVDEFNISPLAKHTGDLGTAEAGNLYLRFVTTGQSNPTLFIARVLGTAVAATSTMGYEAGKVWVHEAGGSSTGTTQGIDGTFANQSDDFDNGQTIADNLGTSFINIHPGDSITLTAALEGYVISMVQATLTGGSQDVGSTRFNEGVYQGTFTRTSGFPSFADGRIFGVSSVVFPQFVAFRCSVVGTLTLSEAANQSLIDCQAGGTAIIDCASLGSGLILNLVRWTGNLTLNNLASGAVVNLNNVGGGDLVLNGADATVNIDGDWSTVTNNLTGSPTVIDNAITLANINTEADTALSDYDPPTKAELDSGFAALNDLSAAEVNAEVDTAFADYDPPTKAELDAGFAALNDLSAAQVNAEVDTALADYDAPTKAELDAGLAALNDLSAAEVNAEVVDALNTDTYAEPGAGAPGATISLAAKIGYLYKGWRNKKDNDGSQNQLYADDELTVDQTQTTSVSGSTVTKGEWS